MQTASTASAVPWCEAWRQANTHPKAADEKTSNIAATNTGATAENEAVRRNPLASHAKVLGTCGASRRTPNRRRPFYGIKKVPGCTLRSLSEGQKLK